MKVALVDMPFSPVDVPSPALGLLAAVLRRAGVEARVLPLKYTFVERAGVDAYVWIGASGLLGEWLFAGSLFGSAAPDREGLLRLFAAEQGGSDAALASLRRLAGEAERFVEDCAETIDWGAFDAVGFTTSFCQLTAALALARRLKERASRLAILFGGASCEGEMGEEIARRFPFVDALFSGEAEVSLPAALARLAIGRPLAGIPGVIVRDAAGEPVSVPARGPGVAALDDLPFPDYDDDLAARGGRALGAPPVVSFEASRGCFWARRSQCLFCGLNGETIGYRAKSPGRVVDELRHLAARYGPRLAATDNVLGGALRRPLLAQLGAANLGLRLFFETRADLRREDVSAMAAAGVCSIQPGIESFGTGVLKAMRKGTTAAQNIQLLKWCYEEGIWPSYNLIVGTPGEDPAAYGPMAEHAARMVHLPPPARVLQLRLDRFSPLHAAPERFGLVDVAPLPAYGHIFPFPPESLRRLAYFFQYRYADGRDPLSYVRPLVDVVTRDWSPGQRLGALRCVEQGADLAIVDDRDPRGRRVHQLRPPAAHVYRICDQARTADDVSAALAARGSGAGPSREALAGLLHSFVREGLSLELDGCFIALAVTPRRPLAAAPRRGAGTYLL